MAKNLANFDLDRYEDVAEYEHIKKRGQDKDNKKKRKTGHREGFVDPSDID